MKLETAFRSKNIRTYCTQYRSLLEKEEWLTCFSLRVSFNSPRQKSCLKGQKSKEKNQSRLFPTPTVGAFKFFTPLHRRRRCISYLDSYIFILYVCEERFHRDLLMQIKLACFHSYPKLEFHCKSRWFLFLNF